MVNTDTNLPSDIFDLGDVFTGGGVFAGDNSGSADFDSIFNDLTNHSITIGGTQLKFNSEAYSLNNPDVADAGLDPFGHLVNFGIDEALRPVTFNGSNGEIFTINSGELSTIKNEWRNGREEFTIDRVFDEQKYLIENPDVRAAVESGALKSGLQHWQLHGDQEGRQATLTYKLLNGDELRFEQVFDEKTYLEKNPDVAAAVAAGLTTPYEHYRWSGFGEGREAFFSDALVTPDNEHMTLDALKQAGKDGKIFNPTVSDFNTRFNTLYKNDPNATTGANLLKKLDAVGNILEYFKSIGAGINGVELGVVATKLNEIFGEIKNEMQKGNLAFFEARDLQEKITKMVTPFAAQWDGKPSDLPFANYSQEVYDVGTNPFKRAEERMRLGGQPVDPKDFVDGKYKDATILGGSIYETATKGIANDLRRYMEGNFNP